MNKLTISYYDNNALEYFNETRNGNMNIAYEKFLRLLERNAYILDLGCGSGRDSKYFLDHGYKIKAIDGSKELCALASKYINQTVENRYFQDINEINEFDAIWACSSLLHITEADFLVVLKKLLVALKDNGYIYICLKNGKGEEYDSKGRYYHYYTKEEILHILSSYEELLLIDFWNTKSTTNLSEEKTWNNFILKKVVK